MSKESRQRLRAERVEKEWRAQYQSHVEAHEQETANVAMQRFHQLQDAATREAIGLPVQMPEESLLILARAHAYDVVGPRKPKVSSYDAKSAPTILHNVYR